MHKCKYCLYSRIPHFSGYYCFAYSKSERPDKKFWAHFPKCLSENCPLKHPELLEGAILK